VTSEDRFAWPWPRSGQYSARSTYKMLTPGGGGVRHPLGDAMWRNKEVPKAKQFVWLAAQDRVWTSEHRFRHGLQASPSLCEVCLQQEETVEHLLPQCVVSREVMSHRTNWETPRGRYDEHISKFSLSYDTKVYRPVGERHHFRRLLLADFGNGARKSLVHGCFGASSNVEPAHNTTKILCPNLQ
jgi:hypothetical protein